MEPKRIAPRSPRAALEPDHMPVPSRRSRRVRNPLVIMGNAVFTALVLVLIVAGGAVVFGKSRFEAPGPLQEDKIVSIPPRTGMLDIADLLNREGVVDANRFVFLGGVFALKARSDLKAGEYLFPKRASMKDVVETILEGKVVQHQLTIPEGLTSEQIVARLLENDVLSGGIERINLSTPGFLSKAEGAKTQVSPILTTSERAMQIPAEKFADPGAVKYQPVANGLEC
jgi:UPF0755 protein